MHDIRGWDYGYLDYAENKLQLDFFLQEQDEIKLLEQAKEILAKNVDTISFGFVAGRALALDASGRNTNNPLYSLWGELRQRAREILQSPPFEDPLGYIYLDYRLAVWVISTVGIPTDVYICLKLYKKYNNENFSLASDVAATIINLGQQSYNLYKGVQKDYINFLQEELELYPKDNFRAIRGLLLDGYSYTWWPYLEKVHNNPDINKKLDSNVLFFLLQSSIPIVVEETVKIIKLFSEDKERQNPLYFFYQQATEKDKNLLTVYLKIYEKINNAIISEKKFEDNIFDIGNLNHFTRLLTSKSFHSILKEEKGITLLEILYNKLIIKSESFDLFLSFFLLLSQYKYTESQSDEYRSFLDSAIKQASVIVDEKHNTQLFPLNSKEFLNILQDSDHSNIYIIQE